MGYLFRQESLLPPTIEGSYLAISSNDTRYIHIASESPTFRKKRIKLSVQVYLSKQFYVFLCKDAVGRLQGLRRNPALLRCNRRRRDYLESPSFLSLFKSTISIEDNNLLYLSICRSLWDFIWNLQHLFNTCR